MKLLFSAATVALSLALASCLKDSSTCLTTATEPIIKVTGPKTVAVNQSATFSFDYPIGNACGTYSGTTEDILSNTQRYVSVQVRYEGCSCPQALSTGTTTYTLRPNQAGTYLLNFATVNGYITDTLVVK